MGECPPTGLQQLQRNTRLQQQPLQPVGGAKTLHNPISDDMLPARNQYTPPVTLKTFVEDILRDRSEPVIDDMGIIACRRGRGPGFSTNSGGYTRVNFAGSKVSIHASVLEVVSGKAPADRTDASHLCGNPWCFQPTHLVWESRASNIARRGCAGRVLVDGVHWVRVCQHAPECKVTTPGTLCDDDDAPSP